jgi:hypothetical protein
MLAIASSGREAPSHFDRGWVEVVEGRLRLRYLQGFLFSNPAEL